MRAAFTALVLAFATPVLAETPPDLSPVAGDSLIHARYACEDDTAMEVVFLNTAAGSSLAVVATYAGLVPMQVAISASGARYLSADGVLQLWTKGDAADLVALEGDKETPLRSGCVTIG